MLALTCAVKGTQRAGARAGSVETAVSEKSPSSGASLASSGVVAAGCTTASESSNNEVLCDAPSAQVHPTATAPAASAGASCTASRAPSDDAATGLTVASVTLAGRQSCPSLEKAVTTTSPVDARYATTAVPFGSTATSATFTAVECADVVTVTWHSREGAAKAPVAASALRR